MIFFGAGCTKNEQVNSLLPNLIISDTVTAITAKSATFSVKITSVGSTQIIEKGICFSTSKNPTVESSTVVKSSSSTTINQFNLTSSLFSPATVYYVRGYAKNSTGVEYSNEITFKTLGYLGQGGGLVFYDKGVTSNGWRYLEMSPTDLSVSYGVREYYNFQWGKDSLISGANLSTPGGGFQNTLDMINANLITSPPSIPYAAQIVKNYSLNGYNDWYLPCDLELNLIWSGLGRFRLGDLAKNGLGYWSSTQKGKSYANYLNLDGVGGGGFSNKVAALSVRAVRRY